MDPQIFKEERSEEYSRNAKHKRHTGRYVHHNQKSCGRRSCHQRDWRSRLKREIVTNNRRVNNKMAQNDDIFFSSNNKIKILRDAKEDGIWGSPQKYYVPSKDKIERARAMGREHKKIMLEEGREAASDYRCHNFYSTVMFWGDEVDD